jgi:hypothetical protein
LSFNWQKVPYTCTCRPKYTDSNCPWTWLTPNPRASQVRCLPCTIQQSLLRSLLLIWQSYCVRLELSADVAHPPIVAPQQLPYLKQPRRIIDVVKHRHRPRHTASDLSGCKEVAFGAREIRLVRHLVELCETHSGVGIQYKRFATTP